MMRKYLDKSVGKLCLLIVICQSVKSEGACPKMDLRVAKGMNTRGYDKIRVSVITTAETEGKCDFSDADFDYSEKFFGPPDSGDHGESPKTNKMSQMTLRTTIKTVIPGAACTLDMGGEKIVVKTPAKGGRTRGLLFADPCIRTHAPGPTCTFGDDTPGNIHMKERFSTAINALVGSDEVDFWGIIGDNFYDASGDIMVEFWEALSLEAKAKPFITVPGNHDFWNAGAPELSFIYAGFDHGGYGWMQYFAQDVVGSVDAAPFKLPKNKSDPSWPGKPKKVPGTNPSRPTALPLSGIPPEENFVFWHQIGSVASFGYSGAHATGYNKLTNHGSVDPYIEKFCKWVGESDDVVSWMVFGHWNEPNLGARTGMDTPSIYREMVQKPGCAKKKGLYFEGHEHCNHITSASCAAAFTEHDRFHPTEPVPASCTDPLPVGYMIGGSGMGGKCAQQSGFVVVDSMAKDIAVDNYDLLGGWAALSACWAANKDQPVTKCSSHAQKWRKVSETADDIAARQPVRRMTPADVPKCASPAPPPPSPPPPPQPSTGPVKVGDKKIPGDFKAAGFRIGQDVTIDAGNPATEEDNQILAFGSMILKNPLKFAHKAGTLVSVKAAAPPPGPGSGPGGNMGLIIGGIVGVLAIVAVIVGVVCHFKGAAVAPALDDLDGSQLNPVTASNAAPGGAFPQGVSLPPTQPTS